MPPKSTVSLRRRRLGAELRKLRDAKGLRLEDVAEHVGWNKAKLSRIELARVGLRRHDLHSLLDLYEADAATRAALDALVLDGTERRWWMRYADLISVTYQEFIAYEAEASHIQDVNFSIIPGLLQSPDYSRAVITAGPFITDPDDVDGLVLVRGRRQCVLTDDAPVRLTAVVTEAALHQHVGGTEVLRGQLAHLLERAELPNVSLSVLPFAATGGAYVGGVTLFHFAQTGDSSMVFLEYQGGTTLLDTDREISRYQRLFDHVLRQTLSEDDSFRLIEQRRQAL
ncbi:helix-turn-helix domain-containing protein [Streptomycetaceae bacterium NBC_01309]